MTESQKDYYTKVYFSIVSANGDLTSLPKTEHFNINFDATDATIHVYIEQFRKLLTVAGFAEQTINDYLGEKY